MKKRKRFYWMILQNQAQNLVLQLIFGLAVTVEAF